MVKNYLKIALRNLIKFKAYSFINILGLAIGVAACIMILLFVNDELSYDKFNKNADRIYRVHFKASIMGKEMNSSLSPAPLGAALVKDFPEVIQYARILHADNMLIRYKENVFNETRFFWADSTIFDVFTMQFIKGNSKNALNEPHSLVLTESQARKYFGNEDPLNKIMNFEDGTPYTVKGVIKDCPANAHFHYDMFASLSSIDIGRDIYWVNMNFHTYIVLKKDAAPQILESKLPEFVKKNVGPQLYQLLGIQYDNFQKQGYAFQFLLQPLTSIHLNSDLTNELEPNGDIKYVYIFSIIAMFILGIACINFMNLSTARSEMRSKEVGVRKVLGSNRSQLIKQFLFESIILTSISVVLAIGIVEISLPVFNSFSGKQLHTDYFHNILIIPALAAMILIIGLAAGSYPAFFLSSFKPIKVLKGRFNGMKGNFLRSGLVVFQFSISIILFVVTFIVGGQLNYMQSKKLGFNKEQVLVIKRAWAIDHPQIFKDNLLKNNLIINASYSDNVPSGLFNQVLFKGENSESNQQHILATMAAGYDFTKTLGLNIKSGRYFDKNFGADTQAIVINESTARMFNLKYPVGKRFLFAADNKYYTIIGILKDFHFESVRNEIKPLVLFLNKGQTAYLTVKVKGNIPAAVSFVKGEWKKNIPNKPFEYFFLDDEFNKLYSSEQKIQQIFTTFSMLAIFIACLGLFGLAAFTAERKTKEIGIRKTLGATVPGIMLLLSGEFIKWVLIANVIAWPVAYYFMYKWLQDFAYKTDISPWIFILAGMSALFIALLTVSTNAIKAATANPIKSLKYE